jgi:hypothetical protein
MKTHPSQNEREPLEIEMLVTADERRPRRVSIEDHARWHATGRPPHEDDGDIGELIEEIRRIEDEHISNKKRP